MTKAEQAGDTKPTEDTANAMAFKVAALLAVDPKGLGGVILRGPADPLRDEWLEKLRKMMRSLGKHSASCSSVHSPRILEKASFACASVKSMYVCMRIYLLPWD
jgi:hypothetical protein